MKCGPGTPARSGVPGLLGGGTSVMNVTVSERFADPPICLYDPESRVCFVPGKVVELDERELTVLQKAWLDQGALVIVDSDGDKASGGENLPRVCAPSCLAEMAYVDLYRKAKKAGLRYAVRPKKSRLIEDLTAAQAAAGVLTRPGGMGDG